MPITHVKPQIFLAFSIIIGLSMLTSAQNAEAKGGRWNQTDSTGSDTETTTVQTRKKGKKHQAQQPVEEPVVIVTPEPEPEIVDSIAPIIHLPADISLEATSAAGALLSYSVSSSDNFDSKLDNGDIQSNSQVSCLPASGSILAIGQHRVECNAVDTAGNSASGSFNVEISDTTEPNMVLPLDAWGDSSDGLPTAISYQVATYDEVDSNPQLACIPASGDLFAVGETQVNCTAQDSEGNASSGSFIVNVYDVSPDEPAAPPTPVGESSVVLAWQNDYRREDGSALSVDDISAYEIVYSRDKNFSDAQLQSVPAIDSNGNFSDHIVLESIESGAYYFAISVIDQNGLPSHFSAPIAVNID